jgi:DNA excision repair protein ERCC-3
MPGFRSDNPLIVQGDHTILAEVASPRYEDARDQLARFAELIKAPEHVHTYRVTPLSIWNACAAGVGAAEIIGALQEFSKYAIPEHVSVEIRDFASRYGRLRLVRDERGLVLFANDVPLAEQVARAKQTAPLLGTRLSPREFLISPAARVLATLGKKAARLTDTVLELHESKIQSAVAKKLREAGIFIRT